MDVPDGCGCIEMAEYMSEQRKGGGLTREDVLSELPEEERELCRLDEAAFGAFYLEETENGWRRLDPSKVVLTHD